MTIRNTVWHLPLGRGSMMRMSDIKSDPPAHQYETACSAETLTDCKFCVRSGSCSTKAGGPPCSATGAQHHVFFATCLLVEVSSWGSSMSGWGVLTMSILPPQRPLPCQR